jgi:hypothetical protein
MARKKTASALTPAMTRFEAFTVKHPRWHRALHAVEWFVDKATIYVLVLLTLVLIADFTLNLTAYDTYILYLDIFIITFFVIDLLFKYAHTTSTVRFVRLYWLEIVAVLPVYYLFRFFAGIGAVGESVTEAQRIAHEALLTRDTELLAREARVLREARLFSEAELAAQETAVGARIVRFVQGVYRIVAARLNLAHQAVSDHAMEHGGKPLRQKPLHVWALSFLIIWTVIGLAIIIYEAFVLGWAGIAALFTGQGIAGTIVMCLMVAAYVAIAVVVGRMVWQRKTTA